MRLSIIFLSIILFSCYSEKKATKQINKAIDKKPVLSAEIFRKKFPCESIDTVVRIDTAWDYVEFECPDKPAQIKTDTFYVQKNVQKNIQTKQIIQGKSVVVAGKTEYKTITIKVKDSAEIFILNNTIKEFEIKEKELNDKIDNRNKSILWLLIALIISTLIHIIRK